MTAKESQKLELMMLRITEIKSDVSELKSKLLNPDDGALARANRNTSFRKEVEPLIKEIPDLIQFKKSAYRIIWILVSAITALGVGVVSMHP